MFPLKDKEALTEVGKEESLAPRGSILPVISPIYAEELLAIPSCRKAFLSHYPLLLQAGVYSKLFLPSYPLTAISVMTVNRA